jgi:disulfide bond formation protein DsbB
MFCCSKRDSDKIVAMASILILGGVLPLMVAYLSQLLFHLIPCHFCLLQRYPYVALVGFGSWLLLAPRMSLSWRAAVALGILALLTTGTLGLIHTGIESGYLHYTGGCVAQPAADHSLEALRAAILNAPLVSCKDVAARIFGLSMASWNVLWAAFVIVLIALQYRFERARRIVL